MRKINCLIIDDDPYSITTLTDYLSAIPQLDLIDTFSDPVSALSNITPEMDIDILFLDIDMPAINGIELATCLRARVKCVIFVSSHSQYLLEAFGVMAKHFMLKPVDLATFVKTTTAVIDHYLPYPHIQNLDDEVLFLPGAEGLKVRILRNEILFAEAANNHVKFVTTNITHEMYMTMKQLKSTFRSDNRFMQVHKSFIINRNMVIYIMGNEIRFGNGKTAPMGREYKHAFQQFVNARSLLSDRLRKTS